MLLLEAPQEGTEIIARPSYLLQSHFQELRFAFSVLLILINALAFVRIPEQVLSLEKSLKPFGIRISVHVSSCYSWGRTNQSTTLWSLLLEVLHRMPGVQPASRSRCLTCHVGQDSALALGDLQALKIRTLVSF